jgi:hypothetical protein
MGQGARLDAITPGATAPPTDVTDIALQPHQINAITPFARVRNGAVLQSARAVPISEA